MALADLSARGVRADQPDKAQPGILRQLKLSYTCSMHNYSRGEGQRATCRPAIGSPSPRSRRAPPRRRPAVIVPGRRTSIRLHTNRAPAVPAAVWYAPQIKRARVWHRMHLGMYCRQPGCSHTARRDEAHTRHMHTKCSQHAPINSQPPPRHLRASAKQLPKAVASGRVGLQPASQAERMEGAAAGSARAADRGDGTCWAAAQRGAHVVSPWRRMHVIYPSKHSNIVPQSTQPQPHSWRAPWCPTRAHTWPAAALPRATSAAATPSSAAIAIAQVQMVSIADGAGSVQSLLVPLLP